MKNKFIFLVTLLLFCGFSVLNAQSYVFGIKGGPSLASQKWNNFHQGIPLLGYQGALFMESHSEENKSALYGQIGYHTRGTTFRSRSFVSTSGNEVRAQTFESKHFNASLGVGIKQKFPLGPEGARGFYGFGARLEYNIKNDLRYVGLESGINKVTYGVSVLGGFELPFSEFVGGFIELSFNPDLGKQIFVFKQVITDTDLNREYILPEQNVLNLTFELSVGIRFLHKIVYID